MADLIEFTTWRRHQQLFYKITSSGLTFYVKGYGNAAVGLATSPDEDCIYWIVFGNNNCWINCQGNTNNVEASPCTLISRGNYTKLWITWDDTMVKFGIGNNSNSITSMTNNTDNHIQYVTFTNKGGDSTLHWKILLPPQIKSMLPKKIGNGKLQWIKVDKNLPKEAIIGGYEEETLYIMRAMHMDALTPGKYVPSKGVGYVAWGLSTHVKNKFEILCGYDYAWVQSCADKIPTGAVEGGYIENSHEIMYVGRALHNGYLVPGKIAPSHGVCFIPYKESEVAKREYEIMVSPCYNNRSENNYYLSRSSD